MGSILKLTKGSFQWIKNVEIRIFVTSPLSKHELMNKIEKDLQDLINESLKNEMKNWLLVVF